MDSIFSSNLLEDVIDWIKDNLNPEDVFEENVLSVWAEDNGYILEEEIKHHNTQK